MIPDPTHPPEASGHDAERMRCALVSTGGTIATRGSDVLDRNEYMYGGSSLDVSSSVDALPEFVGRPELEVVAFLSKPSHDLDQSDQLALARLVERLRDRADIDAVVVQHGTNTLEETAFLLDLLLSPGKPVVLVGSMRPAGVLGTDADANLIDALRVATDPNAVGRGVLVSFGGAIFAGNDVTKIDTRALAGFGAPAFGSVGVVEPDGKVFLSMGQRTEVGLLDRMQGVTTLPRVDIVLTYSGVDGSLIESACDAGAKGIVSAGAGAGFPAARELSALRDAAEKGILVCRSSRVQSAYVQAPGRTTVNPDPLFLWSGHLNPFQARGVLGVALAAEEGQAAGGLARSLFERF